MSNDDDLYGFDSMVILRQKFLNVVDRNFCAASMLDRFYAEIATGLEYAWYHEKYEKKRFDFTVEWSIGYIIRRQCDVFTEEEIINGLNLLIAKDYIRLVKQEEQVFRFWVNKKKIDIDTGRGISYQQTEDQPKETPIPSPLPEELSPIQEDIRQEDIQKEPTQKHYRRSEIRRVEYHNNRASRVGLAASLTIVQWTATLERFNHKCALCPDGTYEVIEHFVPLIHGGGTTEYNCIPSCAKCNRLKHDTHPSMIPETSPLFPAIKEIQEYLETRRAEVEA
jgi:5-methylcytosine-specific restriction endonuclease McrA